MKSNRDHTPACSAPPPLSDDMLSAALDGAIPAEVERHLRQCRGCARRLERASRLEGALSQALNRWDCPEPALLGDYHLGLLASNQQRALSNHLSLCVHCSAEVEELRRFLTAEPHVASGATPVAATPGRLQTLVARLLPRAPLLQLAGVRGADTGPLIAQSSEATIILEPDREPEGTVRLRGQIADEMDNQERWNDALVELRQQGALVATAVVDDAGGFACGPIPADAASLRVTASDGTAVVVEEFVLE